MLVVPTSSPGGEYPSGAVSDIIAQSETLKTRVRQQAGFRPGSGVVGEVSGTDNWDEIARRRIEIRARGGTSREVEWDGENPEDLFVELVRDCAADAGRVLDVGCGEGSISRELAGIAKGVVGLDISRVALEEAATVSPEDNLCFVRAEARRLPFTNGVFDLICSRRGPGSESVQTLSEIRRAMRPGAMLVALIAGESHRIETQEIFGRGLNWPPVKPVRFAIPERLQAAGLELVSFAEYYGSSYYPDIDAYAAALGCTSLIPDFDPEKDARFLREVERKLATDRGIRDTEHAAVVAGRRAD